MGSGRQLLLLISKNFLLQFRHPIVTLFEIAVPTVFVVILILIRMQVDFQTIPNNTEYKSFSINQVPSNLSFLQLYIKWNYSHVEEISKREIMYVPNTSDAVNQVMKKVERKLDVTTKGFSIESEMLEYYQNLASTDNALGAVIFDGLDTSGNFTDDLDIKIRFHAVPQHWENKFGTTPSWLTHLTFPMLQTVGPREPNHPDGGIPGYYITGFLQLQHAVAMGIAEVISHGGSLQNQFTLKMQRYPYPPYINDKFLLALQFFFPVILFFSFIYPTLNIVRNLVTEKEKHLKESMKMMGLSNWLHWLAWFIKYFIFLTLSTIIMTILLTTKVQENASGKLAVYRSSDPSVLFVYFTCYLVSMISFSFLTSVFFSKSNSATAGAGILFFLSFIPYFAIFPRYGDLSLTEKLLSSLVSNTALSLGAVIISMWEGTGSGIQWNNVHLPASPDDSLTLLMVMMMFLVDSAVYLILAWYIEAVFPGDSGIPQPWYFPFTRQYWCGTTPIDNDDLTPLDPLENNEYFEKEPVRLNPGVQIMGLSKVFPKNKIAVNNISLNMYQGQITALLGHNGAGKTTTISMLTGLFPPTSGTAIINGYNLEEDIHGVHESLGICPQHDVLFDELTVEEHLRFFCKLKNYLPDLVESEVKRMVEVLGLESKRDAKSQTLSGGMKRKLSVGIALVGGSKVVMLDEPTSGMDPSARRYTWDLLQSQKEDRTILLTTHFMEEADVLGDRIAIMADGKIQCCGSPLFLKKKYGAGYHMKIVKGPNCDVDAISTLIHSHVPHAELESNVSNELSFCLPNESSATFEKMFTELEKKQAVLGISSYGASVTTMEEVFLKVGEYSQQGMQLLDKSKNLVRSASMKNISTSMLNEGSGTDSCSAIINCANNPIQNQGFSLFCQQLHGLLMKRILYTFRNCLLTASQLILPLLFITLSLVILKTMPKPEDEPPLLLNLNPFRGTTVPYTLYSNASELEKTIMDEFVSQFHGTDNTPTFVSADSNTTLLDYLISEAKEDIGKFNLHNIIALNISNSSHPKPTIKAMFNNQAYHSPAISLAAIDNALLRTYTNRSSISLRVTNHPLPRTPQEKEKHMRFQSTDGFQIAQNVVFSMSFLAASFAVFLVKEASCKAKHLQSVSGVNLSTFWLSNFLWDFLNYLVPCFLVMAAFAAFQQSGLSTGVEQGRILLVFIFYGMATLPSIYCSSFLFKAASTAYVRLCLFIIVTGIGSFMTVTITEIPDLDLASLSKALDWVFAALLPAYNLGRSFYNLYANNQNTELCKSSQWICEKCAQFPELCKGTSLPCCRDFCEDNCIPWNSNYFAWDPPGIGRNLLFLSMEAMVFTVLLIMLEMKVFRSIKYLFQTKIFPVKVDPRHYSDSLPPDSDTVRTDDDVLAEQGRILQTPLVELTTTDALIMRELSKVYWSLVAVDRLCLGVRRGECFGLLGVNGAGKTSTFKMITGDEPISYGDSFIEGCSIKTNLKRVQQYIGYCPQFDGLIDQLTGRETLTLFARLRGVPESLIPAQMAELSKMLYLDAHIDKIVSTYSGGNKRKLSTAVALIGNPPIVLLDEPTTGMDPVARRCLWDALSRVLERGQSIVLTSHSMEECDALCSRLAIMVNGKLRCLGSPQHLKSKFGEGYTLLAKVGLRLAGRHEGGETPLSTRLSENHLWSDIDTLKEFIEQHFPGCVLKGEHQGFLHYHIPAQLNLSWAQVFGTMEQAKQTLNIEDYSVSQTTLEQVFLNFARAQREMSVAIQ